MAVEHGSSSWRWGLQAGAPTCPCGPYPGFSACLPACVRFNFLPCRRRRTLPAVSPSLEAVKVKPGSTQDSLHAGARKLSLPTRHRSLGQRPAISKLPLAGQAWGRLSPRARGNKLLPQTRTRSPLMLVLESGAQFM